ncbi:F-box protein CPR1 [Beta vulgaris subsp. vulgaris]|uniref:F-box protein CPR1 n=1 Tax=Beta vulgaris subsp. vulgaris TaxID=3555 RepID=UPI002036F5BA|nr:F-box protein CPR1 [Beta vulgaris subsp. vulgaris]XP_048494212.1 F-box protein CPR1 [Beta vulgaris subsp. vulgaris]
MIKQTKFEESPITVLTEDIILNILHRLPLKSLGKCKVVSKSWHSLISNPEFAKFHLQLCTDPPLTIALQYYNTFSRLENSSDITNNGAELIPLEYQFPATFFKTHFCFLIGSCDGLVCIYFKMKSVMVTKQVFKDMMFLWNPMTNERKEITLPKEPGHTYVKFKLCWFGSVPSIDDYKIVLVYIAYNYPSERRFVVYSFKDRTWRQMHDTLGDELIFGPSINLVFKNEALHCLVSHETICKFDLVRETFEVFPLSIPGFSQGSHSKMLGVLGEDRSLYVMFSQSPVNWLWEVWLQKEHNKWDSWRRLYNTSMELSEEFVLYCSKFLGFTYGGILCVQLMNELWLIDPTLDPPLYAVVKNPSYAKVFEVFDYVESLISPVSVLPQVNQSKVR